jgi:ABC-2 type transport system permease protein
LGAAYILRALGDAGDGTLSWFFPIGWAQKTRPFAGERWWPFVLFGVALATVLVAAGVLGARRDLGGGLVRPRRGRAAASRGLGHPIGLAVRLQRGSLIGWSAALVVTGIAYGAIAPSVGKFISANKTLADMMARAGGGASLVDSYIATSSRVMAIVATCFAIQAVLRLRSEETALRAEPVLATPVSRWRWAAGHLAVAFLGSVVVLVLAGTATGSSYWLAGGGPSVVLGSLGAAIVYTPAIWVMIGLTLAIVGLAPRVAGASWVILAACFVVGFLGVLLKLPRWLHDLSPFERVPQVPAGPLTLGPIIALTAIAGALTVLGVVGLRRRDIA